MGKARKRKGRPVHGVIVLDKPLGITSNSALQQVKRSLNAQKAGHTGALDPLATGVLPLCFGEATKFSQILLEADKEYVTTACLGVTTSTGDVEGEITSTGPVADDLIRAEMDRLLDKFRGEQKQIPSMYSALKKNGVPLYKLARQGKTVEREARDITISDLQIIGWNLPLIELRVRCSKGTYIRTLVEDIGRALGCGAHVVSLRRIRSGPYLIEQAVAIEQIRSYLNEPESTQLLLSVDSALMHYNKLLLNESQAGSIMRGQTVTLIDLKNPLFMNVPLRLYNNDSENAFLGLGIVNDAGELKAIRLLNTSND